MEDFKLPLPGMSICKFMESLLSHRKLKFRALSLNPVIEYRPHLFSTQTDLLLQVFQSSTL